MPTSELNDSVIQSVKNIQKSIQESLSITKEASVTNIKDVANAPKEFFNPENIYQRNRIWRDKIKADMVSRLTEPLDAFEIAIQEAFRNGVYPLPEDGIITLAAPNLLNEYIQDNLIYERLKDVGRTAKNRSILGEDGNELSFTEKQEAFDNYLAKNIEQLVKNQQGNMELNASLYGKSYCYNPKNSKGFYNFCHNIANTKVYGKRDGEGVYSLYDNIPHILETIYHIVFEGLQLQYYNAFEKAKRSKKEPNLDSINKRFNRLCDNLLGFENFVNAQLVSNNPMTHNHNGKMPIMGPNKSECRAIYDVIKARLENRSKNKEHNTVTIFYADAKQDMANNLPLFKTQEIVIKLNKEQGYMNSLVEHTSKNLIDIYKTMDKSDTSPLVIQPDIYMDGNYKIGNVIFVVSSGEILNTESPNHSLLPRVNESAFQRKQINVFVIDKDNNVNHLRSGALAFNVLDDTMRGTNPDKPLSQQINKYNVEQIIDNELNQLKLGSRVGLNNIFKGAMDKTSFSVMGFDSIALPGFIVAKNLEKQTKIAEVIKDTMVSYGFTFTNKEQCAYSKPNAFKRKIDGLNIEFIPSNGNKLFNNHGFYDPDTNYKEDEYGVFRNENFVKLGLIDRALSKAYDYDGNIHKMVASASNTLEHKSILIKSFWGLFNLFNHVELTQENKKEVAMDAAKAIFHAIKDNQVLQPVDLSKIARDNNNFFPFAYEKIEAFWSMANAKEKAEFLNEFANYTVSSLVERVNTGIKVIDGEMTTKNTLPRFVRSNMAEVFNGIIPPLTSDIIPELEKVTDKNGNNFLHATLMMPELFFYRRYNIKRGVYMDVPNANPYEEITSKNFYNLFTHLDVKALVNKKLWDEMCQDDPQEDRLKLYDSGITDFLKAFSEKTRVKMLNAKNNLGQSPKELFFDEVQSMSLAFHAGNGFMKKDPQYALNTNNGRWGREYTYRIISNQLASFLEPVLEAKNKLGVFQNHREHAYMQQYNREPVDLKTMLFYGSGISEKVFDERIADHIDNTQPSTRWSKDAKLIEHEELSNVMENIVRQKTIANHTKRINMLPL